MYWMHWFFKTCIFCIEPGTGAPLQLRNYQRWPSDRHVELRSSFGYVVVTLRRLSEEKEIGFDLGESGKLTIFCEPIGVSMLEDGERLDLSLNTNITNFPVAGSAWGWFGCGGRWWFEQFRLPAIQKLFKAYHEMVHEQMMLYYVAALKS